MRYKLPNPLTINAVPATLKFGADFLKKANSPSVEFDLSEVTAIDSAGIAMLLELYQIAKKDSIQMTINGITPQIIALCRLYKLV